MCWQPCRLTLVFVGKGADKEVVVHFCVYPDPKFRDFLVCR